MEKLTDRELLELAAKAAGIKGWQSKHGYWNMTNAAGEHVVCCNGWARFNPDTGAEQSPTFSDAVAEMNWNPLVDDGDALRLAIKLGVLLDVRYTDQAMQRHNRVTYWIDPEHGLPMRFDDCGADLATATRRAIVRAAAEIGKTIK